MAGWRGAAARVLLNPVSQKVIGRIAGDRDQAIERHGLLRAMLLADVRNGVPVADRAAHLAEAFGAAPEPYEEALRSYRRRPPDYLTSGVVATLSAVLGRPAQVLTAAEQEVYDWERRLDTLPLDQAIAELRALSPRIDELIDGHPGGLPAHLPDAAEKLSGVRQLLSAVAAVVGPKSEASDRRLRSPVAQNLVLRCLQGEAGT
ncbi:MAG: hypothetical protein QOI76_4118 [Frankiales bacterium]|nr:hypothetical protein [Frankiales bacterium]